MSIQNRILKFYRKVNQSRDGMEYLHRFWDLPRGRFACLYARAGILQSQLRSLAEDLSYLSKLRLYVPVVCEPLEGTDGAQALCDRMARERVKVKVLDAGKALGPEVLDLCQKGIVPLLRTAAGEKQAWQLFHDLALEISPLKALVLFAQGGLKDSGGGIVSQIKIREHSPQDWEEESAQLFSKVEPLARELGEESTVQVVSADLLLPELFTRKGRGTFLTLGYELKEFNGWDSVDHGALEALIQESFGKKLMSDYFDCPVESVILEKQYRGAAVLAQGPHTLYLDKFAVKSELRNRGLGRQLFGAARRRAGDSFFWRASVDNEINGFYFRESHRYERVGPWNLFARNLDDKAWRQAREFVRARPATLVDEPNLP